GSGLAAGDHFAGAIGAARPFPARPAGPQQIAAHRGGGARYGGYRTGIAFGARLGHGWAIDAASRRLIGAGCCGVCRIWRADTRIWGDRLALIARPIDAITSEFSRPTCLTPARPGR